MAAEYDHLLIQGLQEGDGFSQALIIVKSKNVIENQRHFFVSPQMSCSRQTNAQIDLFYGAAA